MYVSYIQNKLDGRMSRSEENYLIGYENNSVDDDPRRSAEFEDDEIAENLHDIRRTRWAELHDLVKIFRSRKP